MSVRAALSGPGGTRGHHAPAVPTRSGTAGQKHPTGMQCAPPLELRETGRAPPAAPGKPKKTAVQSPFWAGSKIATHSTCDVIGKMLAWAQAGKQQVRGVLMPGWKPPGTRSVK